MARASRKKKMAVEARDPSGRIYLERKRRAALLVSIR
jgi:hypothetical protein